ncbi:mitogen-activated protein kinase kinase kinase 20-like [Impatiens glandulifera]|uniref:mitogen-activated protein kinase kinase kinase 20-like n=1 Tax=Impatiens glandulifera TaxID=253017 RepID=UPI001FB13F93|nr:mitogen-activated protein kinase kinase kinase 20-like [Impatiens glandulifera]
MEVSAPPKSIKIWERGKMIGAGGYGRVYLARILPSHPLFLLYPYFLMAVKSAEYSQSSSLHHERYLFNKFRDCPHIIRFLGYDFSFEKDQILSNIFLEYASGGSLRHRIKVIARIDEIEARSYTKSILCGLRCIHARGYVHCDINASNILLVHGQAKIADLGLMRKVGKFQGKFIGTREYMPPESIESGEYGTSTDIWGLGCIVFEMLTEKDGNMRIWMNFTNYGECLKKRWIF